MNNTGFSKRIEITPILGWALADDELVIRVRSLLRWKIRYNSIHVEAEEGHVTLSGQVDSSSDRDAAEQIIRKLSGVVGVTNRINAPDLRASEDCKSQAHKVTFKECLLERIT
jgi:BON domain-containing protein